MTTDRDQATRDRLAEALLDVPYLGPLDRDRVFDALLPVVADLIREGQAEALETAADDMPGRPGTNPAQDWILARAAALRAPREATS